MQNDQAAALLRSPLQAALNIFCGGGANGAVYVQKQDRRPGRHDNGIRLDLGAGKRGNQHRHRAKQKAGTPHVEILRFAGNGEDVWRVDSEGRSRLPVERKHLRPGPATSSTLTGAPDGEPKIGEDSFQAMEGPRNKRVSGGSV